MPLKPAKGELEADLERLRSAIAALEGSEAYKSGAQLNDLRGHVESLERAAAAAEEALLGQSVATERAAKAVGNARQEAAADHDNEVRYSLAEARTVFQSAVVEWRAAVTRWVERVQLHHVTHDLGAIETLVEIDAVIDELIAGQRMGGARFEASIAPAIRHHESQIAQRAALLEQQRELVAELEERAAELAAKQFPDPPMLGWQQRKGRCIKILSIVPWSRCSNWPVHISSQSNTAKMDASVR